MSFCGNCGKEVDDGAKFCGNCGAAAGVAAGASAVNNAAVNVPDSSGGGVSSTGTNQGTNSNQRAPEIKVVPNVKNHLLKAVISTLLFIPFGVVAIIFATRVKPAVWAKDYEAAKAASKNANLWGNLAIVTGIAVFGILFIPKFNGASAEAKMKEAPSVMRSFESMYLNALAEMGNDADIGKNYLIRDFEDLNSKWFKYEYVTYAQGGIVGLKATALSNIGKFAKGDYLQTVVNDGEFTNCVGGNEASLSFVQELFNLTAKCSGIEKMASGSAPAPAQTNNTGFAPEQQSNTGSAKNLAGLVPSDYEIYKEIKGDLNKDSFDDYVVVTRSDGFEYGIIVAFNSEGNYEIVYKNYNCLSNVDKVGPDGLDADIKKGVLSINRWNRYGSFDYKFRYQNSDFELIGYDDGESLWGVTDSPIPEVTQVGGVSINFLSNKMKTTTYRDGNAADEEWAEFTIKKPIKLRQIDKFDEFNVMEYISKK